MHDTVKPLAIYLPQFHPIPENDAAWGKDFTEWTNVKTAKPLFEGHYQPHIPHDDVGYYDLRDPEVLVKQAEMAKKYGIYGFAFYHYWFSGKLVLNTPLENMLKLKKPDFPFLYIWANESWSRRWDGSEKEIIIEQKYSLEDDIAHIAYLCENVFCDDRYIKIDSKPVFIVYRPELFPNIKKTVDLWRKEITRYGFSGIYLINVQSLNYISPTDPCKIKFDAAMEFAPLLHNVKILKKKVLDNGVNNYYNEVNYNDPVIESITNPNDYKTFRCVCPSWDNSARRQKISGAYILTSPLYGIKLFLYWLSSVFTYTEKNFPENERFVFINSWNEWGEGCHIEPDKKNGYAYLEAINNALKEEAASPPPIEYYHALEDGISFTRKQFFNVTTQIHSLYNSKTYSVGKWVLFLPKTIRNLFRGIIKLFRRTGET